MPDSMEYKKKEIPGSVEKLGWILLGLGVILGAVAFLVDSSRAFFNYLITFMFVLSVAVGALFIVALEYLAGADWSVPFRRIPEFFAGAIPLLAVLVIPLLFGFHDLFHWTHTEDVEADKILQGKTPYLNEVFFIIRTVLCIGVWYIFYRLFTRNSRKQDATGDQKLTKKNITLSAIFIPIFAVTITIAAVDWLMTLEPHWFSTIFGIYFFSGSMIATLAAITLAAILLKEKGYLHPKITNEHFYSLGALMFAFVNFWAYIAFSQYMLIWYADLPETTFWFLQRWEGPMMYVSLGLIFIHFVIPYFGLVSLPSKTDPKRLKIMSVWLLFAHGLNLYWLIMPTYFTGKEVPVITWMEFTFPLIAIALFIIIFVIHAKKFNLMPVRDPKLRRGLDFHL